MVFHGFPVGHLDVKGNLIWIRCKICKALGKYEMERVWQKTSGFFALTASVARLGFRGVGLSAVTAEAGLKDVESWRQLN